MDQIEIGPQSKRDSKFTAQMRFHQSWYRANILKVPFGTGPTKGSKSEYGNMLRKEEAEQGLNFLSKEIFGVVKKRLEDKTGTVDEFRLLRNLLSSQPMCFNLFAAMDKGLSLEGLGNTLFKQVTQDEGFKRVMGVAMEFAPEPAAEYLDDKTAFDAFVEYERTDGKLGFVGIETKLTEPFSPKEYDSKVYRRWASHPKAPFQGPVEALRASQVNQLWRGHLLMVAMLHHPKSPYTRGHFMVVHHQDDDECAKAIAAYVELLKHKGQEKTFLDYPLGRLFGLIDLAAVSKVEQEWNRQFQARYLELAGSRMAWENREK